MPAAARSIYWTRNNTSALYAIDLLSGGTSNMRKNKIVATAASVAAILAMAGAPTAMAAPTDTMDITLKAAPGNTLVGHTFKFYKLANYGDLSMNNEKTKVTGFSATAPDDQTKTWAKNAISYYNARVHDDHIEIPQAYDEAGAIVNLSTAANSAKLTGVVKELAATTNGLTTVKEVTPSAGQKDSLNVDVPEGVYLIVDSQGMPLLAGTQVVVGDNRRTLDVSSRDGDTNAVTVSHVVTIKSKIASMDKKISDEANNADDPADKDHTAVTVGATYNFQADTTVPSNRTGAFKGYTLEDQPSGMEIIKNSVKVAVKGYNGAYTPVALDAGSIKYEGADVPEHGFVIDGAKLLADHADKQIRITYKAKVTNKGTFDATDSTAGTAGFVGGNAISASIVGKDGSTITDEQGGVDTVLVKTARFALHKTNVTTTAKPDMMNLNGAEFTISHANGDAAGTGMVFDKATGQWSDATSDKAATVFKTGDTDGDGTLSEAENKTPTGVINFEGLGVGEYIVTETKAPEGYLNGDGDRPSLKVTVRAGEDGTPVISFKGLGKNAGLVNYGDITGNNAIITVRNAAKFSELPSTGVLAKTGATVGFSLILVAVGTGLYMMTKRRESTASIAGEQAA